MRRTLPLLLLLLIPATAAAQQGQPKSDPPLSRVTPVADLYHLGSRPVEIPPPEGFEDAFKKSERVASIMSATEDPNNEVLAVHLPSDVLARVLRGEVMGFDFYTKVSVPRMSKARDLTEAEFAGIISHFDNLSPQVLDVNGPVMKSAAKNLREGLSRVTGEQVQVDLDQPKTLGHFLKTKDAFSTMILLTLKTPGGRLPLLCAASFVKANRRLLFVYVYRKFDSEKDAEVLRDFSRVWVERIVAANRNAESDPPAPLRPNRGGAGRRPDR